MKYYFVSLELLKYCLVNAEGLELTRTLKNIKPMFFFCFLSHVVNLFNLTSENYQQDITEFKELKENLFLSFSQTKFSQSQVRLHDLQVYLSFFDGYFHMIIS